MSGFKLKCGVKFSYVMSRDPARCLLPSNFPTGTHVIMILPFHNFHLNAWLFLCAGPAMLVDVPRDSNITGMHFFFMWCRRIWYQYHWQLFGVRINFCATIHRMKMCCPFFSSSYEVVEYSKGCNTCSLPNFKYRPVMSTS